MKNPQTTIAPTFLTHIISAIDGVTFLETNSEFVSLKIKLLLFQHEIRLEHKVFFQPFFIRNSFRMVLFNSFRLFLFSFKRVSIG